MSMLLNKCASRPVGAANRQWGSRASRGVSIIAKANIDRKYDQGLKVSEDSGMGRREFFLKSVNVGVLASLFTFGAVDRPQNIGIQDYGGVKTLSLCPSTPNCIATSEEVNDPTHFVPPWTYNPQDGRGSKNPASQDEAMEELVGVVNTLKPDNFEPRIITRTKDYLYVEYQSPTFGFIDDVEFWFKPDLSRVEYRSASRIGESDGNINRKRIKAIREALQKKGWASTGF